MYEYEHELPFEKDLVNLLVKEKGWVDDVFVNPSEEDLIKNWASIIFNNNRQPTRLGDYPLTEGEIAQLMEQINNSITPLQKNELITNGELMIIRDNPEHTEMFGKTVTLYIFDRNEIARGRSIYQIARQPKFPTADPIMRDRRGDVMLLINGLPVIHVELKSSKVNLHTAVEQLQTYSDLSIYSKGLFSLVQIFVAMKPEDMCYFANPGFGVKFNKDYIFKWADADNNPQTHWKYIAETFLSIPMAHQLIGYYTVADKGDNTLKVLRSYQYYAADRIAKKVEQVNQMHWDGNDIYGGFIEHTTGSGKTLTSFKAAQLIAKRQLADKVVFLVDRIELGVQSSEEYVNFTDAAIDIHNTEDTDSLIGKLKSKEEDGEILIVTSIQKLSRIHHDNTNQADIDKINTKHIVIIVDECHRSTFGDMLINIKHTLSHAIFFGFSGTPIRDENNHDGMTTADIFGKLLHRYSIADGIRDHNVLGFDPYMVETYPEFDVRQAVAFDKANVTSVEEAFADERKKKVYLKYMTEVPMAGYKDDVGTYHKGIEDEFSAVNYDTDKHRRAVVSDIKKRWMHNSLGNKFHAILATSSIAEAVDYYHLLKEEMPHLKVTCLFDPGNFSDDDDDSGGVRKLTQAEKEEALVEIFKDYKQNFGVEYKLSQHRSFKKDLAQRLAHKKPYLNLEPAMQLNILVVVWQMLTGYDSKWVNTLYLDKELRNEHLIQAFSRTNRLNGIDKQNGIIRYYRYPHTMRRNVDDAFKLYSGDKPYDLFVLKLPENLNGLNQSYAEIKELFEGCGIENFERLPEEQADRAMFAKRFQDLNKFLYASRLQGFVWDNLNPAMPDGTTIEVLIDEETYNILLQRYHELAMGGGGGSDDIPYDIDTQISELATGKINTDYMNANFTKYVRSLQANDPTEEQQKILNSLHKSFATLSQEEQAYANVFLTDFLNGDIQLEEGKSFHDYIVEYQTRARDNRTQRFADALGLDAELLRDAMRNVFSESDITNALLKPIKDSMDLDKAQSYFETTEGEPVPKRKVIVKIDDLIRQFILQGGFEIQVPSSYAEMEFEPSMAAEGFEYYKLSPIDHGILDVFGGDSTVLVGCYKTKKHFEWIKANNLYNIRMGARKGSLENEQALFDRTILLVLYNVDKPSNVSVYKINGHQEMTGKELIEIGYPNPNAGKRYMTFKLLPSSIDSGILKEGNLIESLVGNLPNHINGAPVIIEP